MKPTEDDISLSKAALIVGVSYNTIRNWYNWYETSSDEEHHGLTLPKYYHVNGIRTKYFKQEDMSELKSFKIAIETTHRGVMAEFNKKFLPKKKK